MGLHHIHTHWHTLNGNVIVANPSTQRKPENPAETHKGNNKKKQQKLLYFLIVFLLWLLDTYNPASSHNGLDFHSQVLGPVMGENITQGILTAKKYTTNCQHKQQCNH